MYSDKWIKAEIAAGRLIHGGDVARADNSSYSFLTGKLFPAGQGSKPIDWSAPLSGNEFYVIEPAQMIWIRTLESVELPRNVSAFWWQTNTLSRRGLMLINMSMVEAGYRGYLACLFVNFGRESIRIDPRTRMAKLVFVRLDAEVDQPFTFTQSVLEYDDTIHSVALSAPSSFLRVTELSHDLHKERDELVADFKEKAIAFRDEQLEGMKSDSAGAIRSSLGWAAVGLVLLIAATSFVPWLQSVLSPSLDSVVEEQVQKILASRLIIQPESANPPGWAVELKDQLTDLKSQVSKLKANSTNGGNP